MNKKEMLNSLRVSGKHIGISLLVYAGILIFSPGYVGMLLLLSVFSIIMRAGSAILYHKKINGWHVLKGIITVCIIVTIIHFMSWVLGPYGFFATLIIIIGLAAYRIISSWPQFVDGLRNIESMIWGRPLDRSAWQGKRPPRLKFVLRKKRHTAEGNNMTKKKTKIKIRKHVPLWLAWVSIVCLVLLGALAVTENILRALFALHNGAGATYFAGYLVGVLVLACLSWFVPVVVMAKYVQSLRRKGLE